MHSKLRCRIGKERIHHNVKQFLLQKLIKATSCSRSNINFFEEKYYLPGLYETHISQARNDKGYGNGGLYGDYNSVHKSVE